MRALYTAATGMAASISKMPMAKIDHSTTGGSIKRRHCLRVNMACHVGNALPSGKCLRPPRAPLGSHAPS